MLLTLRGTPFLYYGDEIGMPDVEIPPDRVLDPVPEGRDGCRTPMQWTSGPGAGFTDAADTWLPLGDAGARNVADQRADPGSVLNLVRDLIAAAPRPRRPAQRRLRDAAGAGRRVGVAARRRHGGGAEPVGRAGDGRRSRAPS